MKQREIRNVFFNSLHRFAKTSLEDFIDYLIEELLQLLEAHYISFYYKNRWSKCYELLKETIDRKGRKELEGKVKFDLNIRQVPTEIKRKLLFKGFQQIQLPIIFEEEKMPIALIQLITTKDYDERNLKKLQKRANQLFFIISQCEHLQADKDKHADLMNFSGRIYPTTDRMQILKEIITSIRKIYPQFSYYILLSQDHESDSTLPVKTIEYSDDLTKRVSTEALITGKIQLEDRPRENNTYLYAPLKGRQGVYGVLQIISSEVIYFPEEEISFIKKFADIAGQAIENATLYQSSHHLVTDLKLINDVTHKLNSNLQLSEIITIMKEQIVNICNPTYIGFIYYKEKTGSSFEILEGSSSYFHTIEGQIFMNYFAKEMRKKPESVFSGDYTKVYPSLSCRSLMAIPMQHASTLHGVTIILQKEPSAFSFENFKLIESLIQHSALALTNTILKDQLKKSVITDYLTKLYSRNYLDEMVQMYSQVDDTGALVLFDIDDFKQINDTYGHHIGDQVIVQVAEVLLSYAGKENIPARWGGEELAIYLPHATLEEGVYIATEIRKKVEQVTDPKVTLSSGVSTWRKGSYNDVNDLFIRADRALYKAKSLGKNRVITERSIL